MAVVVSKVGAWDVIEGSSSNTPALELKSLKPGTFIKVTAHFGARTVKRDITGGFYYALTPDSDGDVVAITPATQICQGHEGWQVCTLIAVFEVLGTTDGEATLHVTFTKGDLDGLGSLMNFTLLAETLS
jgi:hypothetical protein